MKLAKFSHALLTTTCVLASCALLTRAQNTKPAPSQANSDAINQMVTAADGVDKNMDEIEDIRPSMPEFSQLQLLAKKNLLTARLLQHPRPATRTKLLDQYIEALTEMEKRDDKRMIDGVSSKKLLIQYARAEAAYFKATGNWP